MITPPFLNKGDKVAIVAPARKIIPADITEAVKILSSWGLDVVLGKNLFSNEHSYLSGTDAQRLTDLQEVINDVNVKAVFCVRGGYGTSRILDAVDFSAIKQNPKWIVGFSDITSLHLKLFTLGYESIHGVMPLFFKNPEAKGSVESLRNVLFGLPYQISAKASSLNKLGTCRGTVVGGNLSLIIDSLGTSNEVDTEGKILIVEEIDEYKYKLDRMLVHLKRAKKFDSLIGLAVGYMTDIKDPQLPFGESVEEIFLHHTKDFNFPIGFHFPIGHESPNLAWRHGSEMELTVNETGSILKSTV